MAKKAVEDRTFNVSVIGLSGTEAVKGLAGVGKSCLCNRFINDTADKYFTEHISVLSPSDFSSRVINNDHFLYWGETTKTDEGNNFTFHVIEQTEFIDDVSFQTFKTGRLDPYQKRCVQTKVQSSEKFMYICKDQLGMETDSVYEQKVMPEGKLAIDGFVCCFDVSKVQNRTLKDQVDFVTLLLNGAIKTKKPIVLVTTKTDDADDMFRKEVEKIVARKEYRNINIPIVETSAHENVNVEQAFLVLAHLIDKSKRYKITPFNDAVKARKDLLDIATDAYRKLLRLMITDSKMLWKTGVKKLEKDNDYDHYVDLFGTESAKKLFRQHVRKLREEQIAKREKYFLTKLPDLLQHYLPDLNTIADRSWPSCVRHIKDHPDFEEHFKVVCGEGESWKTTQEFVDDYSETRIPFDMLSSPEAETCFRNHHNALQAEFRKLELKKSFRKVLAENPQVIPGKTLDELEIFFLGKDCFVNLKPHEREQVFEEYQAELRNQARQDFQELLWERLDTFIHQRLFCDSSVQEDVRYITEDIQNLNDTRYRRLDKLADERQLMLINHLGFMECPSRERCFFQEDCAETQVQSVLETAAKSISRESQRISNVPEVEKQLNLVLLGNEGLARDTCKEIRTLFPSDKFMYYDALYSVDYRPIEDDVTMEYNAFLTEEFKPHGCICVYSSSPSLEYLTNSLEVTIKPDYTDDGDDNPLKSIPVIIIQAPNPNLSEKDMLKLRDKGRDLAHVYHGEFIDIPVEEDPDEASQIELALLSLVRDTANGHHTLSDEPELRIAMCIMCGDDFSVDVPLGPLLNSSPTRIECENEYNSILIEANVDNSPSFTKRRIEVVVGSYHNFVASVFKEEEDDYQGFVLVYSPKRKASYYTMKALVDNLRRFSSIIPILILAVTDNGLASVFFTEESSKELIQEGNNLAENQGCMFMTTTANFQQQSPIYMSFFQEAWVKKDEIGESYYTDPNSPPYDEKIDKRPPAPLPKYDTYQTTKSSTSNSQSTEDSEPIYDQPHGYVHHSDSEHERPSSTSPPSYRPPSPPNGELSRDQTVLPSMLRKRQGTSAARDQCRRSFPVIEAESIRLQSFKSLEATDTPHYQFRKSYSMKLAMKEEEEAWALNEPRKQKKAATFPSDVRQNAQDNESWSEQSTAGSRNSDETVWAENDLYQRASFFEPSKPQVPPARRTSGGIQAPIAQPEPDITLGDYASVRDAVNIPFPESDYALVGDALPAGKLQRILSQDRQKKKDGSDSEDSEFSSLEREAKGSTLYTRVNRKPTPHKKKTKQKSSQDGQVYTIPVYVDQRQTHLGMRHRAGHYREKTYESIEKYRELNTLPKSNMSSSLDGEYDLNDSGNWTLWKRRGKTKEEKRIRDEEKRKIKEEKEKQKEQQKMQKKKKKALTESGYLKLQECQMSSNNPSLPQFVETCVEFLEEEGMNTEGIYRIPGNKQQVNDLQNKLNEDPGIDIHTVEDIQVNAVATVLKSFFNDTEPLIPSSLHDELLEAAEKLEDTPGMPDKSPKLLALRGVLKKLYPTNYEVLKYFITHLNRVSQHSYKHNMDARNLALCLWPTIFRMDFKSYDKMATGTKYPPEIVQVLIEQCGFFFHGEDELCD